MATPDVEVDKALRFDLDQAGIARREQEAVELVELRARVVELVAALAAQEAEKDEFKQRVMADALRRIEVVEAALAVEEASPPEKSLARFARFEVVQNENVSPRGTPQYTVYGFYGDGLQVEVDRIYLQDLPRSEPVEEASPQPAIRATSRKEPPMATPTPSDPKPPTPKPPTKPAPKPDPPTTPDRPDIDRDPDVGERDPEPPRRPPDENDRIVVDAFQSKRRTAVMPPDPTPGERDLHLRYAPASRSTWEG